MGIKDAFKLLKSVTIVSKKEPENQVIVIDGSWLVYNTFLATASIRTMTSADGTPTGHLRIIFNKFKKFLKNKNRLIVVWDSGTTDLKAEVKEDRQNRRDNALLKLQEAKERGVDESTYHRLEKLGVSPGKAFDSARHLISLFGIPQISATNEFEAEHVAAEICRRGVGDIVYTKDSDALFFGATAMGWHTKNAWNSITLNDALKFMDMNLAQFQRAGVMMGSDFAPKTPGVGPGTIRRLDLNTKPLSEKQQLALALFESRPPVELLFDRITLENKVDSAAIIVYLKSLGFAKVELP